MKDPEVLSDWLSGNGVGKDDGGTPWCVFEHYDRMTMICRSQTKL